MRYFEVKDNEIAAKISELVYKLMVKEPTKTKYLFVWFEHNGTTVIEIPENYECPIFINDDFQDIVNELGAMLGVTESEGAAMVEYLKTGKIILENLVPTTLTEIFINDTEGS